MIVFLFFFFLFKCGKYNILPSWFPALLLHCSADQICKLDVEDTQVSARLAVQLIQVQGRIQEGGGGRSSAPPGRSALKKHMYTDYKEKWRKIWMCFLFFPSTKKSLPPPRLILTQILDDLSPTYLLNTPFRIEFKSVKCALFQCYKKYLLTVISISAKGLKRAGTF